GNEHYLVVWMDKMQADALGQGLRSLALLSEPRVGLPPLIRGRYRAGWNCLEPVPGNPAPYLSVLVSYDLLGVWNWDALAKLLDQGYPLDVSLDVQTMSKVKARRALNMSRNALMASLDELGRDVELTEKWAALQQAIEAIHGGQTLHLLTVGILVPGQTVKELGERIAAIKTLMAPFLSLSAQRPQGNFLRSLFTTERRGPAEGLLAGRLRRNALSTGTAVALGLLGACRRADTEGLLWGLGNDGSPVFWDGFGAKLDQANHGVFLGMTGSGKTIGVHTLLLREALLRGTQIIEMEPMGHGKLLAQAVGDRASLNVLSFETMTINPLEIVHATSQDQHAHVMTQVALLLKRPLDNFERAAIEAACRDVYATLTPDSPPAVHPRLENLVLALRREDGVGQTLGAEIEGLYVDGSLGSVFNAPGNLDFRLEKDVVVFDFHNIPQEYQTLLYGLVLAALQRECLRRRRERRRIVFVDEFKRMSEEPMLARAIAMMFKTFRTAGVGVWVAEQNLLTLLGLGNRGDLGSGDLDVVSGRYVMENASFYVILAQQPEGVGAVRSHFPQVTESHLLTL
ncbi:MAG: hypothetical protein GY824_10480, partial [Delftia sp.]|nr:hypothetical protein [Delftia sp.]